MATVSDLPFTLLINGAPLPSVTQVEAEVYNPRFPAFSIYENDEVSILFDSLDKKARMYLDALDIVPVGYGVMLDEDGRAYRSTSPMPVPLYKHEDDFDALRVDSFRIMVICAGTRYYAVLDVLPKQLGLQEWRMMRDDLEAEITGLAQDVVRRHVGLWRHQEGMLPPEKLYTFSIIKKYASKVLNALIDLQSAPRYHIVTDYVDREEFRVKHIDPITVRKHLRYGGTKSVYSVPVKRVTYDIQENRLLKKIIAVYDNDLHTFIATIDQIVAERQARGDRIIEADPYERGLNKFRETADQLKKVTAVIKNQAWYKTVSTPSHGIVPHSFALDARYGILFKMYDELRHAGNRVQLDPHYLSSWKKSSSLYEMWCYIKLCRAFSATYTIERELNGLQIGPNMLFPYLSNGVQMVFSNDTIQLAVIFDQFVPTNASDTSLHEHPFYTVGKHKRPDITIDLYNKTNGWYIGSLILECKYRRLTSFLGTNRWSSKEQIQSYYTDNKSSYTFNGIGGMLDTRPIQKVFVLTPDLNGNGVISADINTEIRPLRPEGAEGLMQSLMESIEQNIDERLRQCRNIEQWTN